MQEETIIKHLSQLAKNQNKLILKFKELDLMCRGDNAVISDLQRRLSGLETALLGAGLLTKDGLELHQSFKPVDEASKDEPNQKKIQPTYEENTTLDPSSDNSTGSDISTSTGEQSGEAPQEQSAL